MTLFRLTPRSYGRQWLVVPIFLIGFCSLVLAQGVPAGATVQDALPSFSGGREALAGYMRNNLTFPEAAKGRNIQGMVVVTFGVSENGKVDSVKVLRGLDPDVDAEAVRMVRGMPAWIPGRLSGKAVRMSVNLPVSFQSFSQEAQNQPAPVAPAPQRIVNEVKSDVPISNPEVQVSFPGGMAALFAFLKNNLHYPEADRLANIQGTVVIAFVVDEQGGISRPVVQRSVSTTLDAEALRVVALMPKWIPGKNKGKAVKVQFSLPIKFSILQS